jgi:hypothetical protein
MNTTPRIWTTITRVSQRVAFIESNDTDGNWLGSARVEVRGLYHLHPGAPDKEEQDRAALYAQGYALAEHNASVHGGDLDRYGWA